MDAAATATASERTIAFFGATGGVVLAALTRTLLSSTSIHANALARTPEKLTKALLDKKVPQSTIDSRLTIVKGDVDKDKDVASTLTASTTPSGPRIVDTIISGIGAYPVLCWSPPFFTLSDATICGRAMAKVLSTLSSLQAVQRTNGMTIQWPMLVAVSTTGISKRARDVPLLLVPLYHWFLAEPHVDKKVMEELLWTSDQEFAVVRASLLMDGEAKPVDQLRVGWEAPVGEKWEGTASGPGAAIGYTITRESVGNWIWEEIVAKAEQGKAAWRGKLVSLTE